MPPLEHSLAGASNAHQWLECTPSIMAEQKYGEPDKGSEAAAEGTLAHKLAEKVRYNHKNIIMRPMSAQERRVVHTALQGEENISTYRQNTFGNSDNCLTNDRIIFFKYAIINDKTVLI